MTKHRKKQAGAGLRYGVIALSVVVLGLALATTRDANAHPDPRSGLTPQHVADPAQYSDYPRIAEIYSMAGEIPEVLDGLYCHCDCSLHSGHRSLLTCFQDDHGAACDVCLTEAELAYRMTKEGSALKEIRKAVDALYQH